jgi:surfactin family lipopeptide synthetase A
MNDLNQSRTALEVAPTDLSASSRESQPGASVEQNLAYWRQKLAGIPAILELPTDRPRPPAQSLRAARERFVFPRDLQQALEAWSEREGVSLPVLLLAAFETLLTRYTRQDDIVVGLEIRGAADAEAENTQETTAAIRIDTSDEPTFRQLLLRVNDVVSEAREHQDVPWERLVERVQPDRDASRHPIFQALFSFIDSPASNWDHRKRDHAKWEAANSADGNITLKVDLQLEVEDAPAGLAAHFTYASDLFDASTIVRMAGHFLKLLAGIAANPDEKILSLPLLPEAERHQLVVEWNDTRMQYPRDRSVHQLFEAQAAKTPNAIAVVFGNRQLTYSELDRRANQLAHHLIKRGATPDSLIGICLERSLEMVVGLLGILKAGSAYVPLDPAYPRDRIAYMLENAEAPLLVTQQSLTANLPATEAKTVLIDSDWTEISKQSQQSPALTLDPANRAYVIYTSGSTGKPKGVQIPHRAVVNFLTTMAKEPGMQAGDRLLAVTTLCFDIAGLEMYLPLTVGALLELVTRETASDGNQLAAKLKTSGTTVMQATPATWRMLLEAGWTGDKKLKILIGGEAVSQKLAGQLVERSGSVWNVYGPTETTIWSTLSQLHGDSTVTIGRPIGNTEIFILDKLLQPVPIGVAGELHIGGDGLARGYLKRPELTAEKFIPRPLNLDPAQNLDPVPNSDPDARLYKTGDLVRYLPNGNIEFLGRIDHQIKIRGFRIELGEIEAVLRQHSAINETVVVAREDTPGDKRVVAYFVATGNAAPTVAELRAFLREKLPEYMLPSVFVTLKTMPLTPNGKVNRQALPAPDQADLAPKSEFAAARDENEARLVRIWENVLNVRPVGIRDNFFELGGHSLIAVRLMNQVEEAFGKTLPIATLLQASTIEQLAALVGKNGSAPAWSCLVPIQTGGAKRPFFCIHGANGAVVRFHSLSRYLGADQPFHGVQAQGLDAAHAPHTSIEEMATHYVAEIRKVQPNGPYLLGGYSLGGAIAFEMAQQLAAQGQTGSTVVLFDTNFPEHSSTSAPTAFSALRALWSAPVSQKAEYISRIVTAPLRLVQRRRQVAKLPPLAQKVRAACLAAEKEYRPQPYAGRVVLFRSSHEPLGRVLDPRAGWSKFAARGLETYPIDGNHENILLEPQVRAVAERLKACLDQS